MRLKFSFFGERQHKITTFFSLSLNSIQWVFKNLTPEQICQHLKNLKSSVGISAIKFEGNRINFLYTDVFVTTAVFVA